MVWVQIATDTGPFTLHQTNELHLKHPRTRLLLGLKDMGSKPALRLASIVPKKQGGRMTDTGGRPITSKRPEHLQDGN